MKLRRLASRSAVVLALSGVLGCSGDVAGPPVDDFEIEGSWLYLGPSPTDGAHDLTIGGGTLAYAAIEGTWSSKWSIKAYDNDEHRFQVTFTSGSGTYLPVGQNLSGRYDLSGTILAVQLADGLTTYPTLQTPATCTDETGMPIPNCRLYVRQND